jgi:hypothetical protein
MKRIVVHIDKLVLKGIEAGEQQRISLDLQAELGRLLAEPAAYGQLASLGHVPRLRIGGDRASAIQGEKPSSVGISAARAIAKGLSR